MTPFDTSRSLTRRVPIYDLPGVVEYHGPVNSTKLLISRSELMKGLSPKRLKLTELSTFYKHFLHPKLTQSATQRLYLFVYPLGLYAALTITFHSININEKIHTPPNNWNIGKKLKSTYGSGRSLSRFL